MTKSIATAVLTIALLAPAHARCAEDQDFRTGFYLKLDLGLGMLRNDPQSNGSSSDQYMLGFALPYGISVGGMATRNVALGVRFWGSSSPSPSLYSNGTAVSTSTASLGLLGFGPTLGLYSDDGWSFTVTPAVTGVVFSANNSSSTTSAGFGGQLCVGKEWQSGKRSAWGVEAQLSVSNNGDSNNSSISYVSLAGGISLTYTFY